MFTSLLVFVIATTVFFLLLVFFAYEKRRGGRVILKTVRSAADRACHYVANLITTARVVLVNFVLGLTWRKVVHVCLRSFLASVARFYERLVSYFEYNYRQTSSLKKAKKAWQDRKNTYLGQVSEHQEQNQLTDKEKSKRKAEALEG